jgi:hypothetical protein
MYKNNKHTFLLRLAVVFKEAGIGRGDIIHTLIANHNLTVPAIMAATLLGAAVSLGDPFIDVKGHFALYSSYFE